jgi:hypothetical protein
MAKYTVTVTVAHNSADTITAYSLNGVPGVITGQNISVTMPYGTNVSALIATFTTSGVSVQALANDQVSGLTPNDFTNPIIYTVTAYDGSMTTYTVTVTVAHNTADAITAYSLDGIPGVITGQNKLVTMPYETNINALIATFTTTGINVKVDTITQTSGVTANDFTNPVDYIVTASDGSAATYKVVVVVSNH